LFLVDKPIFARMIFVTPIFGRPLFFRRIFVTIGPLAASE
jgi:hypothetical protein